MSTPKIKQRQAIERTIVAKAVDAILAAGHAISIDNGGDSYEITRSTDKADILSVMFATDEEHIMVHKDNATTKRMGWLFLVYGNSGWDVMSDYTTNLDSLLTPAKSLADQICYGDLTEVYATVDVERDAKVKAFLASLASLETETEIDDRTEGDGMDGDAACAELSAAIDEARKLLALFS